MLRPNPNIDKLKPISHGGINFSELERLGISPDDVLDFSVSTNPFGPPQGIEKAISRASVDRYPDSEATELRLTLSSKLNVPPDAILVGSGSTEIIRLLASAYFRHEDMVVIPRPTYSEYGIACQIVGARVLEQAMPEETYFRMHVAETIDLMRRYHPKGIFLCNPNNPTGQYLSLSEVKAILTAARDSLVILDEAYIAFTEDVWSSLDMVSGGNLVLVRSMTKDYALAGLRLGYAVSTEAIISVLNRVKPPWNVSSVAQTAGVFALKADGYIEERQARMRQAKEFLISELRLLGLFPLPSETNFFLVRIGNAAGFRQALLKKGILVRDCTSFGLPNYIRLAPRTMADCQRLITAINEIEWTR